MLAVPAERVGGLPLDGATWAYEVKWDGMRVLVDVQPTHDGGELHIRSRNEKDVKVSFPELHGLAGIGRDVPLVAEGGGGHDGRPAGGPLAQHKLVAHPPRPASAVSGRPTQTQAAARICSLCPSGAK